ncbi:MAG: 2-oxo acid dehydrogenase subunit E2, partial [Solirubrobacterales bacterium]|nr:2-oxo acid dehydrogenase subunit E2 [Solirubrobacterales bacterium]
MPATGTVQIEMPAMGESVSEGIVLEWHVAEGDQISEGDTIVEVSTDKIDAEVPATVSGTVTKLLVEPDEVVKVGQALAEIEPGSGSNGAGTSSGSGDDAGDAGDGLPETGSGGEGDADLGESGGGAAAPEGDAGSSGASEGGSGEIVEVTMPEMGESVAEGTVLEWHKAAGDAIEEGETLVEVSTDKVDAEVPATASGTVTELLVEPDDVVKVGQALARIEVGAGSGASAAPSEAPTPSGNGTGAEAAEIDSDAKASPVAKRIAAAEGLDLSKVEGSGPGGKVMKADVLAAAGGGNGAAPTLSEGEAKVLRGPAGMLAKAMDESRSIPTATSFRTLAVDTLDAKRKAINGMLAEQGMKVSFTHLIAWAIVEAAREWPAMFRTFEERDGKPNVIDHGQVNLGIAVDIEKKDGSRSLMVPRVLGADQLDFKAFHAGYEDLIRKTRENSLTADDFQGTNITLTNPGGLGTIASVPRLMTGQGTIVATGSIAYPPEWKHAAPDKLNALGVSKVMTMTSTYDHRIIQGAESGSFLRRIDELLSGNDEFYEGVAESLGIDAATVTNAHPASASAPPLATGTGSHQVVSAPSVGAVDEELLQAVQAATSLLKAYRTHGHLSAHLNPLGGDGKGDPALEPENLNLTPELMKRIPASILRIGVPGETLLDALPRMRDAYCGSMGYQIEHLSSHQQRMWLREMIEAGKHRAPLDKDEKRSLLHRLIQVFQFERFLQKAYLGQKMFSIEGLDATVPMIDELATLAKKNGADQVVIGMAHRGRLSVLAHNLGRSMESIMAEFEGAKAIDAVKRTDALRHGGTGDVKYHHGAEGLFESGEGDVRMRLYPNPSHLEFVGPVVEGGARAAQTGHAGPRLNYDASQAVPLLLHGDAAFPGQGVVAENFNMQSLEGYSTGGTVHIIQDNSVGFTTDPMEGR